jgi:hypothetical protein
MGIERVGVASTVGEVPVASAGVSCSGVTEAGGRGEGECVTVGRESVALGIAAVGVAPGIGASARQASKSSERGIQIRRIGWIIAGYGIQRRKA